MTEASWNVWITPKGDPTAEPKKGPLEINKEYFVHIDISPFIYNLQYPQFASRGVTPDQKFIEALQEQLPLKR